MRHLVAYFGSEPENLACALCSARAALSVRGTAGVPEGYGLGFVQGGDVLLQKRPRAELVDVDLYNLVKDTRAEALVGRVGLARDGNTPAEDVDPFRFRSWLFGSITELGATPFEDIRERLIENTPDFLRRNIRGKSPSEHVFHLFLAFLHDAGLLEQPTPSPTAVHGALRGSLALVDQLLAERGAPPLAIALAATNGRCFVATGCGYPVRYLNVEGISDCPVCQAKAEHHNRNSRRVPHESLRALVIEADRAVSGRPGWNELPDRTALVAGPDRTPHLSAKL